MKTTRLKGKVAMITGAGGGLGRAICETFARYGANIVATDIRAEALDETVKVVKELGQTAFGVTCDVTNSVEVNRTAEIAIEKFGGVDIVVNNAGIVREQQPKPIWEISDNEWRLGIDTNLTGAFYCCRAISRHMVQRGKGAIINIASAAGIRGVRDQFMYCSAKAGVILLTQSLAQTWASLGIRVNCIAPGTIRTFRPEEEYEKRGRFVPVGRVGDPKEISYLALYLASDASSYITGQAFVIDGGALAGGCTPVGYAPIVGIE